jgi:hypothetical protein
MGRKAGVGKVPNSKPLPLPEIWLRLPTWWRVNILQHPDMQMNIASVLIPGL